MSINIILNGLKNIFGGNFCHFKKYMSELPILFFIFFFICPHKERGEKIRTNDLIFIRRGS
jgi:hypothetical protein